MAQRRFDRDHFSDPPFIWTPPRLLLFRLSVRPPPPSPPIIWNWRVHYFLDRDTLMELFFLLFVEGINNLTKLSKMTLLVINFDFDVIPKVFEFLQHFLNQLCLA